MKSAITLVGGGPAAGLHIGVLKRLAEQKITFDVWALSCIGAWVGLVYNQCDPGKEVQQTYRFFRDGRFRDDDSYSRFPVNTVFGPDNRANLGALFQFLLDPTNYKNVVMPNEILRSVSSTMDMMTDKSKWNEGDINRWWLNDRSEEHTSELQSQFHL